MGYALVLVRSASLNLEAFARATGVHPDLFAGSSPWASSTPTATPPASCGSPPASWRSWAGSSGSARDSGSTTRPSGWSPTCWTGSRYSKRPCGRPDGREGEHGPQAPDAKVAGSTFTGREVETRIGRALVAGDVRDGAVIRAALADGGFAVTYENPA